MIKVFSYARWCAGRGFYTSNNDKGTKVGAGRPDGLRAGMMPSILLTPRLSCIPSPRRERDSTVTSPHLTRHASFDCAATFSCLAETESVNMNHSPHPASPPLHKKKKNPDRSLRPILYACRECVPRLPTRSLAIRHKNKDTPNVPTMFHRPLP
ncbi:unnamed protein product [Ectocarpus sp. 4 AP-2014]